MTYCPGWGATEFSGGTDLQSEFLRSTDLEIHDTKRFKYALETKVGVTGADPCKGDSGGPLLLREKDFKWTLIGTLVGGGFDCAKAYEGGGDDKTTDWNKISVQVAWIKSIIGQEPGIMIHWIEETNIDNVLPIFSSCLFLLEQNIRNVYLYHIS